MINLLHNCTLQCVVDGEVLSTNVFQPSRDEPGIRLILGDPALPGNEAHRDWGLMIDDGHNATSLPPSAQLLGEDIPPMRVIGEIPLFPLPS